MAGIPGAERPGVMEALLAAEQRSARYRTLLAESDAEVCVLRRKLKTIVNREWAHVPDSPPRAADGAAGDIVDQLGGGLVNHHALPPPAYGEAAAVPAAEGEAAAQPAGMAIGAHDVGEAGGLAGPGAADVGAGPNAAAAAAALVRGQAAAPPAPMAIGVFAAAEARAPAGAGADGAAVAGVGAGAAAEAAHADGPAGARDAPRRKRMRQIAWPANWEPVPFVRGGSKPAGACAGCWWTFQGYRGHRKHEPGFCLKPIAAAPFAAESEPEGVDSE